MSSEAFAAVVLKDGRDLAYQQYGSPDGVPLLVFHGLPGCRLQAALLDAPARRLGVRLIAADRPGVGRSSPCPQRSILSWSEDVAQLADQLGLARFGVLGISCGGPYALACALRLSDQLSFAGLVAGIGPMDIPQIRSGQHPALKLLFALARLHPSLIMPMLGLDRRLFLGDAMAALRKLTGMMTVPDQRFIHEHPGLAEQFALSLAEAYRSGIAGVQQEVSLIAAARGFELGAIEMPVHLYQGAHDRNVPPAMAEHIADRLRAGRYRLFADEGHLSIVWNCAEVFLGDFLAAQV
ncbi:alpha/beta fold hydrolase [Aquipseudomonas guryensis]|jgi:pimeloyl-ACP methyl ester carboxylesterase|uniref:Alpha/beta fold hydrolase n=1 Tax=Aquipseudomonas guryensis TaxID=2759165 RepID=A0A7W4DE86_9GAMM|nr:alpha/beta hydrolase [Pseudomonas guryensis]MBB1520980.1 alpha/beta fold hydrolase [Pseudomonas guryensis]